jgi:hypothetical protein
MIHLNSYFDSFISLILTILFYHFVVGRLFVTQELTDKGIRVFLLGFIPFMYIRYDEIVEILPFRHAPFNLLTFMAGSRFSNWVYIKRSRTWKRIMISPRNSEEFIAQVKERMANLKA